MSEVNSEVRSSVVASWVLLGITCLVSLIPCLGFLSWILGSATILIAVILGVVVITKGSPWHGTFILLASFLVVPVFIFFAPIVTSGITAAFLDEKVDELPSAMEEKIETTEEASDSASEAPVKESAEASDAASASGEAAEVQVEMPKSSEPVKSDAAPSASEQAGDAPEETPKSSEPVKSDAGASPGSPESQ
jgi:hypothetical protein